MRGPVLVTGAQGFIGRYLGAALFRDHCDEVVGVGRSPESRDHFTHEVQVNGSALWAPIPIEIRPRDNYRYVQVDLTDEAAVLALVAQIRPRVVFHLAGSLRDEPFNALLSNNLRATYSVCKALVETGDAIQLIFASSGSVYGDLGADGTSLRESGATHPLDLYSITKRASEDIVRLVGSTTAIQVIIARIFNVVGPGQEERHLVGRIASQIADVLRGTAHSIRVGPLVTSRDFIDVRDVATALVTLARSGAANWIYNVASGEEIVVQRILDGLLEVTGDNPPAVQNTVGRRIDVSRQVVDITALSGLGWRPAFSLKKSLDDVLRYYLGLGRNTDGRGARY
jgi:nucleoside-diphosphate-sugar epimerase